MSLRVRHTTLSDIPSLVLLQRRVYPPEMPPWSRLRFEQQLDTFPQGQLVAELDGRLVGAASALVVVWDDWCDAHSWKEITAGGGFDHHDPNGKTLYGAEVFVDTNVRGLGLGHALYEGRRAICRAMNLKRIIACGRLPGYAVHADRLSPDDYAKRVVWGDLDDPVLGFQLHEGFDFCGVIEDYLPEDSASRGCASLIVWRNRYYDPGQPTRIPTEDIL